MITLDMNTFQKLNGDIENYYIDINSCFHHQIGVDANSIRETHIIPARYSSVNSIILMMRNTSHSTSPNRVKYSTRHANRLQSIQIRHKGQNYPEQPLTRQAIAGADNNTTLRQKQSSEMFLESLSTYSSINSYDFKQKGDMFVLRTNTNANTFNTDGDQRYVAHTYERENGDVDAFVNATTISSSSQNANFGSFFVAVPLSSYKSPELNKAMYSGLNSIGADIFVNTEFGTNGVVGDSLFDYYTHYSSVIVLDKNSLEFSIMN